MKNALAGVASQVPGEYRVGDLHAGDGIGQPGSEDHPVALVGEIVRERERLFREPGEPVTDLGRERGKDREPDRYVVHHGRRESWIQPVHDPHGGFRDDHHAPDGREHQYPFRVVFPGPAERGPEQYPGEPCDTGDLGEREIGIPPGDGGDGVEKSTR